MTTETAKLPNLDDRASPHFDFWAFVLDHGLTSGMVPNVPKNPATFQAMRDMATGILEPLMDFTGGQVMITYGFCSPARARHVAKWTTYQAGDQHVGHETKRNGSPICPRLGFAVDIRVPSATAVAAYVVESLKWDRIYYYGDDRPLHISIPPSTREPSKVAVDMRRFPRVNPPPKIWAPLDFFREILNAPGGAG